VEASVPPGSGPPSHRHSDADEAYYILSGEFRVLDGEGFLLAGAGDFVYIPAGSLHGFKNVGADAARMVFLFTPAGFEGLFSALGEPARRGEPPTVVDEHDITRAAEVAPLFFPD
jgi:quercetin dioxygenase-like cupin family protein